MKSYFLASTLFIAMALSPWCLLAQNSYDVQFSPEVKPRGEDVAYTKDIIGEDEDHLYIMLTDKAGISLFSTKKVILQQVDKATLRATKSVNIFSSPSEASDYPLRSIFNTDKGFVVFFEKEIKSNSKVYAMRYDYDLNPMQKRKEIYSYNTKEEETLILQRPGSTDFTLLSQKYVDEGEQVKVDYSVFDEELFLVNTSQIELDLYSKVSKKRASRRGYDVLGNFHYAKTGDLVMLRRFAAKDDEPEHYSLQFISTKTGEVIARPVELEDGAYFEDTRIIFIGDELILSGFYSDAEEKKKLISGKTVNYASLGINGTFFQRYSLTDRKLIASTKAPFGNEFVRFVSDNNPATSGGITLFKKRKARQDAEDDDISDNYYIRDVVYNAKSKTATFYCEYTNNYSVTTTTTNANGGTTTTTTYYSIRGNLFYYQVSLVDGSMNWYNSIRRYAYYSSSSPSVYYTKTLEVLPKEGGDLMFYKTHRIFSDMNPSDLSGEKIKTKKLTQDFFTAKVNDRDGSFELDRPDLAPSRLKAYQKIQLDKTLLSSYDRTLYTVNSGYSIKPGLAIVSCATLPLCGLGYCIYFFAKNKTLETYTIARITY